MAEPFDYASLVAVAESLTERFGRSITMIAYDTTMADANEPWRGPADPRVAPDLTVTFNGVFVEPESLARLGDQINMTDLSNRAQKVIICTPGIDTDVKLYDEVIDSVDNLSWKILMAEVLRPGPDVCCAFLWVRR